MTGFKQNMCDRLPFEQFSSFCCSPSPWKTSPEDLEAPKIRGKGLHCWELTWNSERLLKLAPIPLGKHHKIHSYCFRHMSLCYNKGVGSWVEGGRDKLNIPAVCDNGDIFSNQFENWSNFPCLSQVERNMLYYSQIYGQGSKEAGAIWLHYSVHALNFTCKQGPVYSSTVLNKFASK